MDSNQEKLYKLLELRQKADALAEQYSNEILANGGKPGEVRAEIWRKVDEELQRRDPAECLTVLKGIEDVRLAILDALSSDEKFTNEVDIEAELKLAEIENEGTTTQDVVTINGKRYGVLVLEKALIRANDVTLRKFLAFKPRLEMDNNMPGCHGHMGGEISVFRLITGSMLDEDFKNRARQTYKDILFGKEIAGSRHEEGDITDSIILM